jgi:hypothetical protein
MCQLSCEQAQRAHTVMLELYLGVLSSEVCEAIAVLLAHLHDVGGTPGVAVRDQHDRPEVTEKPHTLSCNCPYPGGAGSTTGSSFAAPSVMDTYPELTHPSVPSGAITCSQIRSGALASISRRSPLSRTCTI